MWMILLLDAAEPGAKWKWQVVTIMTGQVGATVKILKGSPDFGPRGIGWQANNARPLGVRLEESISFNLWDCGLLNKGQVLASWLFQLTTSVQCAMCNSSSVDQSLIFECSGDGGDDPVPKPAPELKPLELTDPEAGLILSLLPATHSQTYYSPPAHTHTGAKANGFALQNGQNYCTTEVHTTYIYMHQEGRLVIVFAAFQLPPCLFKLPLGFDFSNLSCHLPPWATASLLLLLPITQRALHPLASTHLSSPRSIRIVLLLCLSEWVSDALSKYWHCQK